MSSSENNENKLLNIDNTEEVPEEIPFFNDEDSSYQAFDTGSNNEDPASAVLSNPPRRLKPDHKLTTSSKNIIFAVVALIGVFLVFGFAMLCDKKGADIRSFFIKNNSSVTTFTTPPSTTKATTAATTESTTESTSEQTTSARSHEEAH